jgi:lipid-binding SYLF domain-containing protein
MLCPSIAYIAQVISDCRAIAVLHVLHAGLHSPSASGSGVMVSRLRDGQWSGPSAIVVDFDLPESVDVADIVVTINNKDDLDALLRQSEVPGNGLDIEPGPIPESDAYAIRMHKTPRESTANFLYAKSKGHLLQLDLKHLAIRQADGENEAFYGVPGVSVEEILSGQARLPSDASTRLKSTLNVLGQQNPSLSGLPKPGDCPGDRRVRAPKSL